MSTHSVSVIIPINEDADHLDKIIERSLAAWSSQTIKDIQFLICAKKEILSDARIQLFASVTGSAELIETEGLASGSLTACVGGAIDKLSGEYTLIASACDHYPANYIEQIAGRLGAADFIQTKAAALFPGDLDEFNISEYDCFHGYDSGTPFKDLISNGAFWGYYYTGNKTVRTDILKKAYDSIAKEGLSGAGTPCYALIEELLISASIYANSGSFIQTEDTAVVLDWASDDKRILGLRDLTDIEEIKVLKRVFGYMEGLCANADISGDAMLSFERAFLDRYWWRVAWVYPEGKRPVMEKIIKQTAGLSDLTLQDTEPEADRVHAGNIDKSLYPEKFNIDKEK